MGFNSGFKGLTLYAEEITGDYQCGIRCKKSTTDHTFCIPQILEKKNENTVRQSISYYRFQESL